MFTDRTEAGRLLAARLRSLDRDLCQDSEPVVLALPRGGVPVGYEVAKAIGAPLDVFLVRKLGAPGQPELAMGAIASGGVRLLNDEVVLAQRITHEEIENAISRETRELQRRELAYRGNGAPVTVEGRCVLLVDDGIATGYTMRAAVEAVRKRNPQRVIVAIPVAAQSTCAELQRYVDVVICLLTPADFLAVGQWYRQFEQTSDDEVGRLLERAAED